MMAQSSTLEADSALVALSAQDLALRPGDAIRFQTVSQEDPSRFEHEASTGLHDYL
jgi:hypothetical protein